MQIDAVKQREFDRRFPGPLPNRGNDRILGVAVSPVDDTIVVVRHRWITVHLPEKKTGLVELPDVCSTGIQFLPPVFSFDGKYVVVAFIHLAEAPASTVFVLKVYDKSLRRMECQFAMKQLAPAHTSHRMASLSSGNGVFWRNLSKLPAFSVVASTTYEAAFVAWTPDDSGFWYVVPDNDQVAIGHCCISDNGVSRRALKTLEAMPYNIGCTQTAVLTLGTDGKITHYDAQTLDVVHVINRDFNNLAPTMYAQAYTPMCCINETLVFSMLSAIYPQQNKQVFHYDPATKTIDLVSANGNQITKSSDNKTVYVSGTNALAIFAYDAPFDPDVAFDDMKNAAKTS